MAVHRDPQVEAFLVDYCKVGHRGDGAAQAARRCFRDQRELEAYLEACLGSDGFHTLHTPGDRDLRYAIELLHTLRVPRKRVMHLAYLLGHLHGLRPSLREMNEQANLERAFERKYGLVSNIASNDLRLVHQNISFEDDESITDMARLLNMGVPASYLGDMESVEVWNRFGWSLYQIHEAWSVGVPAEYIGWHHSGDALLKLWKSGVPLEYLRACDAVGADAWDTMKAYADGVPIEYAVIALGREDGA